MSETSKAGWWRILLQVFRFVQPTEDLCVANPARHERLPMLRIWVVAQVFADSMRGEVALDPLDKRLTRISNKFHPEHEGRNIQ